MPARVRPSSWPYESWIKVYLILLPDSDRVKAKYRKGKHIRADVQIFRHDWPVAEAQVIDH